MLLLEMMVKIFVINRAFLTINGEKLIATRQILPWLVTLSNLMLITFVQQFREVWSGLLPV